jgi:UDP-glucose 4-epimerase
LITGGGGYLGSKLAERLVRKKAVLCLLDIRHNELSSMLSSVYPHVHKAIVDLTERQAVHSFFRTFKPDIIYHFGALLNRARDFKIFPELHEANVIGTFHLLEALQDVAYKKLIFTSSSEVYGTKNRSPFSENQIPDPASPYSLTKLIAENLIRTFSEIHGKPFNILRVFNIFGEDMPGNFFLNEMMQTINQNHLFKMTSGEQIRDFLHIEDLLATIIKITETGALNHETINVCSGKGAKLKDLALSYARKTGKEHLLQIGALPYRENEVWEMVGDNSKMSSIFCPPDRELL